MTQLSKEDIKELRISLSSWQDDYDPVDDAEQHEMFGRAVEAMDMLLAAETQEPVAMRWRWINGDEGPGAWWYHDIEHFEKLSQCEDRECEFVYAAPQPVAVPHWIGVDPASGPDHSVEVVYISQPVAVPEALERMRSIVSDPRALPRRKEWISGQQYSYVLLENVEAMVDEACRAAVLQPSSGALQLPDDTKRLDWLVSKTVNVREPLVYGSRSLFWSQTISDDWEEEHKTTLREQIDAAIAGEHPAAPQEPTK